MSYINRNTHIPLLLLMVTTFMVMTFIPNVEAGATPPPGITTLWVPVGSSTDDAEENVSDGDMYLASSDLELIQDGLSNQKVGLRFRLEIPAGAIIESANIQFTTDEKTSETTLLTVYGEAIAHALTFSNTDFDISNRTLTTANVAWTPPPWLTTGEAGPDQQTPDLSVIVQEVVNIAGWTQGNSIAIIITGNGKRVAESFTGSAPPVLHVSFSTTSTGNQAPDAVDDGTPDEPAYTTTVDQSLTIANGVEDIAERNDNPGIPSAVISTSDTSSSAGGTVLVNPDGSYTYTPAAGFLGVDSFTYTLENTEGSDSATVYINVKDVSGLTTLWIPVITSSDDAEEDISDGIVRLTSSDLELIRDGSAEQLVGVRFQTLDIPPGSTIVEAYIQYTADEDTSEETNLRIYGEASSNALTFSSTLFDISGRSLTTASVPWMPTPWNTNEQTSSIQATPDVSVIVQEIVDRNDWAPGNAMAFITSGSGKRVAESFNGTDAPVLHVSFVFGFNQGPDAVDDDAEGVPAYTTEVNQPLIVLNGLDDIVERNDFVGVPAAVISSFDIMSIKAGTVLVNPDGSFIYTPPTDFVGIDSFHYELENPLGVDSATVYIEVLEAVDLTSLWVPVTSGSDDAEEDIADGDMDLSSSDLEMIMDRSSIQLVGVRFQQVDVPVGAHIEEAYIQYQVDEDSTEQTDLTIHGEASINGVTFSNVDYDISTRTRTAASVDWTPPAWNTRGAASLEQRTPDLSEIVQEIVNLGGWTAGNAMTFITSGSGNRVAESFNGTAAPELHLVYSTPQTVNFQIGDTGPAGGIVFYISDNDGTYGTHGLEAAPEDQGDAPWGCNRLMIAGADGTPVGTGAQNTVDIVAGCTEAGTAAEVAYQYVLNGYDDWFLPSKDTLFLMYGQRAVIGIGNGIYLSSSENNSFTAWWQSFFDGGQIPLGKSTTLNVRAVRAFPAVSPPNSRPSATNVSITDSNGGLLIAGDSLSGNYTYSDVEDDSEGASTFRWLRNGVAIAGATSTSYTTVSADERKAITFEAVPVAINGTSPGTTITSPSVIVFLQIGTNEVQIGGPGPAGGTVIYISDGDGIVGTQGLEVAPEDQGSAPWGCKFLLLAGADGSAIGTGAQNTDDILVGCTEAGTAAELADQYTFNGFEDWFLPSTDELNLLYEKLAFLSGSEDLTFLSSLGLDNDLYWSSTEVDLEFAWSENILRSGDQFADEVKSRLQTVLSIRAFPKVSPPNSRPSVTDVSITDINGGLLIVGDTLTANYTYNDSESDSEGVSTFRWLRNGVAIAGAIGRDYTLVASDGGNTLTFEVTPVADNGTSPGTGITSPEVFVEIIEGSYSIGSTGPAGGTVFYISDGDGIVGTQGLEIASEDQGTAPWGCIFLSLAGADGTAIGTGAQNTSDILAGCTEVGIAAELADQYVSNGFDDWFLPSKDELHLVYETLAFLTDLGEDFTFLIGLNFESGVYWSSSETGDSNGEFAWGEDIFDGGDQFPDDLKSASTYKVRAIRAFPAANSPAEYQLGDTGPGGGIVFYISDGDGIVGTQGLEAAPEDQVIVPWGCYGSPIAGADGTAVGTGLQNTADILADCAETGIAAEITDMYSLNGFNDWFLPSKDALLLLYEQRAIVGNFDSTYYWSSKENSDYSAWYQSFGSGSQRTGRKNILYGVRAIRNF